jgi:glycosyltransferase involved in cell wall biosynthesis
MTKKLRHLLLATLEDPYNPRSWSGTPMNMRMALEKKVGKLSIVSNLKPKRTPLNAALRVLLGGKPPRYPLYLTAAAQKQFAKETLQAIEKFKPDAMLTISSHCVVRMGVPPVPTFMFSDAPWISYKETYRSFEPTPLLGQRFARLEADAAKRYTGLIFSSDWAVDEGQRLYGVSREKLHSIPLGASWTPDANARELAATVEARPDDRLHLLYVGKDWERKGGPLAIEIAQGLKAAGVANVRLHVAGCHPEIPADASDLVQVYGFLNPKNPDDAAVLKNLFLRSHFLVVPTRAECFGLVFAEAQAFALPPVSRRVQPVPSIVLDGQTGILADADAPASAYVERILAIVRDRVRYREMANAARAQFESTLTWDRFAEQVVQVIEAGL